jgi:hypothetical protein
LQINGEVFTGNLAGAVGVVGKEVGQIGVVNLFSKCPEMHKPVLENLVHGEEAEHQRVETAFHFSEVNYGDYGFFLFIQHRKYLITVASHDVGLLGQGRVRIAAPGTVG